MSRHLINVSFQYISDLFVNLSFMCFRKQENKAKKNLFDSFPFPFTIHPLLNTVIQLTKGKSKILKKSVSLFKRKKLLTFYGIKRILNLKQK